jgi:ATP-dependent Clp protease adapter protein ClpS
MSAPFPSRRSDPALSPGFIRIYHLVLHRSPGVPLHDVVRAVRRVTRFAEAEATARMWDAHYRDRAVVTTTYLERAEFLAELLSAGGIRVSLEAVHR